jgi:hypothetical protein
MKILVVHVCAEGRSVLGNYSMPITPGETKLTDIKAKVADKLAFTIERQRWFVLAGDGVPDEAIVSEVIGSGRRIFLIVAEETWFDPTQDLKDQIELSQMGFAAQPRDARRASVAPMKRHKGADNDIMDVADDDEDDDDDKKEEHQASPPGAAEQEEPKASTPRAASKEGEKKKEKKERKEARRSKRGRSLSPGSAEEIASQIEVDDLKATVQQHAEALALIAQSCSSTERTVQGKSLIMFGLGGIFEGARLTTVREVLSSHGAARDSDVTSVDPLGSATRVNFGSAGAARGTLKRMKASLREWGQETPHCGGGFYA